MIFVDLSYKQELVIGDPSGIIMVVELLFIKYAFNEK
jgi:hypothetical protein